MKESEYIDMMNGLDARYAGETVKRLSGDAGFEAVPVSAENRTIRRNSRLIAGVLTAAAAAACVLSVTILLPKLRSNPEVVTPAATQSDTESVYEVDTRSGETNPGCTEIIPETSYSDSDSTVDTQTYIEASSGNTEVRTTADTETAYTTVSSQGQTLVSATTKTVSSETTAVTSEPARTPVMMKFSDEADALWYSLWLPTNYHGTVNIKTDANGTQTLTEVQSSYILQQMSGAKLIRYDEQLISPGGQNSRYITSHIAVELNGTNIRWDLYRSDVAQIALVWIDGVCYLDQNACGSNSISLKYYNPEHDALEQIIQYADYVLNPEKNLLVIHLPAGYTGQALVSTITCPQNPIVIPSESTGFILKKMIEAKLTEIPKRDLPTGGPVTVELDGTGIRWDIYTDTVAVIDGKFYEDSSGALRDIELYALGFLGGMRPE